MGGGRIDGESETFIQIGGSFDEVAHSLRAQAQSAHAADLETYVTHSLRTDGFDANEDGTGRVTPLVATPILEVGGGTSSRGGGPNGAGIGDPGDPMFTLQAGKQHTVALEPQAFRAHMGGDPSNAMNLSDQSTTLDRNAPAVLIFDTTQITSAENRCNPQVGEPCHPLAAGAHPPAIAFQSKASPSQSMNPGAVSPALDVGKSDGVATIDAGVRRLLPVECERLQGFPDGWTLVPYNGKPASDGPRYRAIGNSMAVPVMAWIGRRIQRVQELLTTAR